MDTLSYTPAVHTKDFFSRYTLLKDEEVVDIQIRNESLQFSIRDNKNQSGLNGWGSYTFFLNYCMFFTNLGRIFSSEVNVTDTPVASFSDTHIIGLKWSYNVDKIEAHFQDYSHPRQMGSLWGRVHQLSGTVPSENLTIPIQLLTEDICSIKIKSNITKIQKEKSD
jgi:hypothetical protein